MNLVEIAGFLGADPEERFTATGKKVIGLRVATRTWFNGKEDTIWWRVSVWGDRFDKIVKYLKKGSAVMVIGEMSMPETYVDREGQTKVSLSLTAEILKFSPFGRSEKGQEGVSYGGQSASHVMMTSRPEMAGFSVGSGQDVGSEDFSGDDLPF
ncbi:MAG: single-stranded DNA-binding protein [Chlamydiia bacterium]|nr:single-stranded DNA-binding protein [Chlamydiia bacterium]